ncbi:ABC transporter ATP-binding protein [Methylobacterium sp. NMS14P]|uniref:ABC transporter ATP-binding protein n=1 Tax=Methylobacterium sp. NMS14P TaxID=2894310 RepID=UPI0023588871|nr:ABC transporter ATP-binding protein [Methylobacterium sp. NMS14P]WCS27875.1 ABC transporter ATP-binding protein [Methylobacterium sp. NMS14P]
MQQAANDERLSLDSVSVEDLNAALRVVCRLPLELLGFLILLPIVCIGFSWLSTAIAPPYGVYIFGEGLVTWGLILMLALLFGLFWWRGRQIGLHLHDPDIVASPVMSLLSVPGILAERAQAVGMEWSGFYGPLRPRRK